MHRFFKHIDSFLLSIPVTIALIIGLCTLCLIAVLSPFKHIFGSGWFLTYLLFVVSMMIYCSGRRLPRIIRQHYSKDRLQYLFRPVLESAQQVPGISPKMEVFRHTLSGIPHDNLDASLRTIFIGRKYKHPAKKSTNNLESYSLFEKAKYSIFGPHLVHMAIMILLLSGIITALWGNFYDQDIAEGESVILQGTNTTVRLEKFSVVKRPEKNIEDEYASRLRINNGQNPVYWSTLKVNSPLRVDGYRIYQNRFSSNVKEIALAVYGSSGFDPIAVTRAGMNSRTVIPEQNLAFEIIDFIPDFAIDENGAIYNKSTFLNNPACQISVFSPADSDQLVYKEWVFRNFEPHNMAKPVPIRFRILRVRSEFVSGLKFAKNPGEYITYVGLILLVLGTFLSCYKFYRCVIVHTKTNEQNNSTDIRFYALKAKNMFEFEKEINLIRKRFLTLEQKVA